MWWKWKTSHFADNKTFFYSALLYSAVLCFMYCCKWDYESLSNKGNSQYCLMELVSIVTVFKCKSDIDLASRCMCVYVASIFSFLSQYNGCQTILRSFRMTHVITSDMNDVSHTESIFTYFFMSLLFFFSLISRTNKSRKCFKYCTTNVSIYLKWHSTQDATPQHRNRLHSHVQS